MLVRERNDKIIQWFFIENHQPEQIAEWLDMDLFLLGRILKGSRSIKAQVINAYGEELYRNKRLELTKAKITGESLYRSQKDMITALLGNKMSIREHAAKTGKTETNIVESLEKPLIRKRALVWFGDDACNRIDELILQYKDSRKVKLL